MKPTQRNPKRWSQFRVNDTSKEIRFSTVIAFPNQNTGTSTKTWVLKTNLHRRIAISTSLTSKLICKQQEKSCLLHDSEEAAVNPAYRRCSQPIDTLIDEAELGWKHLSQNQHSNSDVANLKIRTQQPFNHNLKNSYLPNQKLDLIGRRCPLNL